MFTVDQFAPGFFNINFILKFMKSPCGLKILSYLVTLVCLTFSKNYLWFEKLYQRLERVFHLISN